MSNARFCIIPARAIGDVRLNRTDMMVLNCLGLFGDKRGWCFPSTGKIAETINCHRVSVSNAIKKLVQCGYVESHARRRTDGGQTSNQYRILFDVRDDEPVPHIDLQEAVATSASPPCSDAVTPPCNEETTPPVTQLHYTPCSVASLHHNNEPTLTPHIKKDITLKNDKSEKYPPEFESFWKEWPKERRCEKPFAHRAWKESIKKIEPDELLQAQKRYLASKEATEGFAPYPAKWLKRERWLEFIAENIEKIENLTLESLGGDSQENRIFLSLIDRLRAKHGDAVCKSWFHQLRPAGVTGEKLMLSAPSRFVAEWIKSHHGAEIETTAKSLWGNVQRVEIVFHSVAPLPPAETNHRLS